MCFHCFRQRDQETGPCPYCGYDPAKDEGRWPTALRPGSILNGKYILGRVLGQGGFGITYVAFDHLLRVRVAVKEYFPQSFAIRMPNTTIVSASAPSMQDQFRYGAERFLEEAKILARFAGNPGIVDVTSFFEENGTAYLIMEYVEGVSMQEYLRKNGGRIPWQEAVRILAPVMEALAAVHRENLLHRDVTPDNIYLAKNGIKLLDFGAARYSIGDRSHSLDVVLKAGYAPKEQYSRRGRQGPWTDVYSVAACFYAAITGYLPPESLEREERDELIPIRARGIEIPDQLEHAIQIGLAIRAENRFQTMEDFLTAIAPFRGAQPVSGQAAGQQSVTGQRPPVTGGQPYAGPYGQYPAGQQSVTGQQPPVTGGQPYAGPYAQYPTGQQSVTGQRPPVTGGQPYPGAYGQYPAGQQNVTGQQPPVTGGQPYAGPYGQYPTGRQNVTGQQPPVTGGYQQYPTGQQPAQSQVPPQLQRSTRRIQVGAVAALAVALVLIVSFVVSMINRGSEPVSTTGGGGGGGGGETQSRAETVSRVPAILQSQEPASQEPASYAVNVYAFFEQDLDAICEVLEGMNCDPTPAQMAVSDAGTLLEAKMLAGESYIFVGTLTPEQEESLDRPGQCALGDPENWSETVVLANLPAELEESFVPVFEEETADFHVEDLDMDGDLYSGYLNENGEPHGLGEYEYASGSSYYGMLADGLCDGYGIFHYSNGDRYEGDFANGMRNGQGTYTWAEDGNMYEGEYVDDVRNGYGVFTWASGQRYEGEFVDGDFNGQGTMYYPDGTTKSGTWKDDEFVG